MQNQCNPNEKLGRMLQQALFEAIDRSKRCCFNCCSFEENRLYCKQHNGNPPPRVVCFGCDNFIPIDEVPF